MRYFHRHSFFPLVIILLTLLLSVFIIMTVARDQVQTVKLQTEVVVPVDADVYRADLINLITAFETEVVLTADTAAQSVASEQAFTSLLDLRVPPEYKQLHLNLALLFTRIQTILKTDDPNIDALLLELQEIKQTL